MTEETASSAVALPRWGTVLRAHRSIVLAAVLAGLVLGWAAASVRPQRYVAEAVIMLQPAPGNPLSVEAASGSQAQATTAMETEAGIMRSPLVAARVAERVDESPSSVAGGVEISVPTGAQMLRVSAARPSAAAAADVAQSYAEEYLDLRQERVVAQIDARLEQLRGQAEVVEENLSNAIDAAADAPAGSLAAREVQLLTDRLAQLGNSISEAEAVSTFPGQVLNPAVEPQSPEGVGRRTLMALGLFAGLLAGLAFAYVRELRRDVVRSDETLDVPNLADVSGPATGARRGADVTSVTEEYRQLRAAVTANASCPHVLAVTAADGPVATGDLAVALARSLAEAGYTTALIAAQAESVDFDIAIGMVHDIGLADVLRGTVAVGDAALVLSGVTVLGPGRDLLGAREMLGGPRFRNVVATLGSTHDYVIIDAAPVATSTGDAAITAADSTVLAIARDQTTHTQLEYALRGLALLGTRVLGTVRVQARDLDPFTTAMVAALWPGGRLDRARRDGAPRYVPAPGRGTTNALLPASPRTVARAAFDRYQAVAEQPDQLGSRRALAARFGTTHRARDSFSIASPEGSESLVEHLSDMLDQPLWAAIDLGTPGPSRKPILELLDRTGRTQAFVKVGLTDHTRRLVSNEALALHHLASVDLGDMVVPKVLDAGRWEAIEYVAMTPVVTGAASAIDAAQRERALCRLVAAFPIHAEVLVGSRWWSGIVDRLGRSADEDAGALAALADRFASEFGHLKIATGAAHGDWTPWNMACTPEGLAVWDWERFDRTTPVGFDNLHYALQSAIHANPTQARRAVRGVTNRADSILAATGVPTGRSHARMIMYLLSLGERSVSDGQIATAARLSGWLLPELERLVAAMESQRVDCPS